MTLRAYLRRTLARHRAAQAYRREWRANARAIKART